MDPNLFYLLFDSLQSSSRTRLDVYAAIPSQILYKNPSHAQPLDLINFTILFAIDGQPTTTITGAADILEICLQLTGFESKKLVLLVLMNVVTL